MLIQTFDQTFNEPNSLPTTAMFGDSFIEKRPEILLESHAIKDTQLLLGINANEGFGLFDGLLPQIVNKSIVIQIATSWITRIFGQIPDKEMSRVFDFYLGKIEFYDSTNLMQQFYNILGDIFINCPTLYIAGYSRKYGNNRPYFYFFNQNTTANQYGDVYGSFNFSTHYQEVQYVFGMPLLHPETYTHEERVLSRDMISIWTSFAKNG
jgi:acetylcholinesterase/cholinesterase